MRLTTGRVAFDAGSVDEMRIRAAAEKASKALAEIQGRGIQRLRQTRAAAERGKGIQREPGQTASGERKAAEIGCTSQGPGNRKQEAPHRCLQSQGHGRRRL